MIYVRTGQHLRAQAVCPLVLHIGLSILLMMENRNEYQCTKSTVCGLFSVFTLESIFCLSLDVSILAYVWGNVQAE